MTRRPEFRKGFLKLQRLGTIEFGEQSRWNVRAPENRGMWAFPTPYFDTFFAYHKWVDIAPKEFRADFPKNPKWYTKDESREGDSPDEIIFIEKKDPFSDRVREIPYYRDAHGDLHEAHLTGEYFDANDKWIREVGQKILPIRTFWYSGELYTHFMPDGSVGSSPMSSKDPNVQWSLMDTETLYKCLLKPGNVYGFDGHYDPSGKHRTYNYAVDHLEVFVPRGRGIIRDKI